MTIYVSLKNFVNHDDCWQLLMLAMSHANDLLSSKLYIRIMTINEHIASDLNESNSSSPDPLASNKGRSECHYHCKFTLTPNLQKLSWNCMITYIGRSVPIYASVYDTWP